MLILGFLRSVAGCLAEGTIPTSNLSRKLNRSADDDDDDNANEDEDIDASSPSTVQGARGTVVITLRNVPPYTNWQVHFLYHYLAAAYVHL
jgi:25S rRNA (uracil2634-N3)-methyltransferase